MSSKIMPMLVGASLLALAGAAGADEPVTLSAAQLDGVSAGGGVNFNVAIDKSVYIDRNFDLNVDKNVSVTVVISGNLATAEASADAFGDNTLAETIAFAQTTEWSSEAFSSAVAATN